MSLIKFIQTIKSDLKLTSIIINQFLRNDHQKFGFNLAVVSSNSLNQHRSNEWSLKEIFDGLLWHAPRGRTSIEKRLRKRFGFWNKYNPATKLIKKKHNLVICDECGSWHEMENICQICYFKVKKETLFIQNAIMKKLGLNPVEKEIVIAYENEQNQMNKDQYFIEIPKERPAWFSSNLISSSVPRTNEQNKISENNDLEAEIVDK